MQICWVATPWATTPTSPTALALFEANCSTCHGDTSDYPLDGLEMVPSEISSGLQDPKHVAYLSQPLNSTQQSAIEKYVLQMQVRENLQQFPFAWWIRDKRWLHEEHTFLQPPPDAESMELWEQHWSDNCDQCHSVGPHNIWDPQTARLDANVGELGIACEACHGPAREHSETYRNPLSRYLARLGKQPPQSIVEPSKLDHERSSAICGQCHAELVFPSGENNDTWFPGERLEDHVNILQLHQPPYPEWVKDVLSEEPDLLDAAFWKDGTMRVAGRDYNAMVMSDCYTKGEMSCISCHDLHGHEPDDQLKPGHRGDAAESLGSLYYGKHTGTLGIFGTLSFNGNKTITTGGGGALLCSTVDLAKQAKHITTTAKVPHKWAYQHDKIGFNYRLPNLNAALGCAQLEQLPVLISQKRALFQRYSEVFQNVEGVELLQEPFGCQSNYWLQTIRLAVADSAVRDEILQYAHDEGILCRPAWTLINELAVYRDCPAAPLPVAVNLQRSLINVPSSAHLSQTQMN
jgi:hypothetical protein